MWPAGGRALSAAETSVIEENAVALGVSVDTLMENAGRAIAEEAARRIPPTAARVAIVAGSGNNGGDGFAAAFYLAQWGSVPEIWLVRPASEIRSHAARRCFQRIEHRIPVHRGPPKPGELAASALVLDALLGAGQSGPLRGAYREAVQAIRTSGAPALSIDVPSGVSDPAGLRPRWTIALTMLKEGMTPATCGEIVVRGIGVPAEAWSRTGPGEFMFFPRRSPREPRRRSGRIVVIGGGPYAGAPALAGLAALRSGAERATVLAPAGAAEAIRGYSPNLIARSIGRERFAPEDADALLGFVRAAPPAAIVIGMGAGDDAGTLECLRRVLGALPKAMPVVVDADALAAIPAPGTPAPQDPRRPWVATPNAGEYRRVFHGDPELPTAAGLEAARAIAGPRHLTLIVKGDPDLLTDGTDAFQNDHHHAAQTVSGAGDVLAGVVGSLLGQGLPPLHAARLGTYWAGDAGLRAAGHRGAGLVATDVIEELPLAWVVGSERLGRLG